MGVMGQAITMRYGPEARGTRPQWAGIMGLLMALLVLSAGPGEARGGGHGVEGIMGLAATMGLAAITGSEAIMALQAQSEKNLR
jgi:hypothetical protein